MSPYLVLFLRYGILAVILKNGFCDENEYKLTKHLLDGYDAAVRPAKNSSEPLTVVFGLALHHIIDVDEKNQILTTNCWVTQVWTDHHLKWNTSEFAGIQVIRVPYNRVWRPDTILYNNADPQYSSSIINTNVIVNHTGEVVWLSHGIFRSSCDIDVEFFPFDEQRCALKWASWTYDGYQIELEEQSKKGDITLLVFYVPSESGEKVTLGISALLSMTVFLMTIRETLPPTEKTPLISLYYGVSICLVSFASGLAVLTLNLHHRGTRVPEVVRSLVLHKLARIVFLNFQEDNKSESAESSSTRKVNSCPLHCKSDLSHQQMTSPKHVKRKQDSNSSSPNLEFGKDSNLEIQWTRILARVHATIERNERRLAEQDKRERTELEWKQIALVSDRILLGIFFLMTIVSTAVILYGSPPPTTQNTNYD
ncbi:PREDICTED: acetylcholine receptor subunit beta-type acr-3-like isoform X2 [Polistes dominula]|uniref:Acetylcholine receptor subunit beta-type acr-3-like isoform X2 n=1 Tax=Polistes dominula TaxID=743375 RepID=A0ABM1IAL9_POLDO|nr:PREDICTED: acetylcholine receptor subunit beta-type acr-3-like isoform X2 [Polistes dominula]